MFHFRFYDGICKWEEGSLTPILHIGWAKPFGSTIGKFDYDIRSQVIITTASDYEEIPEFEAEEEDEATEEKKSVPEEANNNTIRANNDLPPTLAALTAACGEKLLNPNFLTGGEVQPFKTEEDEKKREAAIPVGHQQLSGDKKGMPEGGKVEGFKDEVKSQKLPDEDNEPKQPLIKLYSQKMKGLRNLLLAEKLNSQAILLQMTAQSQVGAGKKASRGLNAMNDSAGMQESVGSPAGGSGAKRARRE